MDERYAIVLQSPMGPKKGNLSLSITGIQVDACLECTGKRHFLSGEISTTGKLSLKGMFQSPLGEGPFSIIGLMKDNLLNASFRRNGECYALTGVKTEIQC